MNPVSKPNLQQPDHSTSAPSLKKHKKFNILGVDVDNLTREEALSQASSYLTSFQRHHIITANSLFILEAQNNPQLKKACEMASMVLPDSSGVSWAALTLHLSKLSRYPGIDLAFQLCGIAETSNIPVYLLGGEARAAKLASRFLYKNYPKLNIAGMRDGYFSQRDEPSIIEDIAQSRARLVLVAMGMPKQEIWIHKSWDKLPPALYIGVGGSFDVWAGRVQRAPDVIQKSGFEWLYRLGQEPKRWKRVSQLPRFALKVISKRF